MKWRRPGFLLSKAIAGFLLYEAPEAQPAHASHPNQTGN